MHVLEVGRPQARQVVVLVPGQFGAADDFRALAEELVARLPDTQVWAVDRREQDLADLSGFRSGPDAAAAYYLGGHYRVQTPQTAAYVGQWGLAVELDDLRQIVLAARDHGRHQVVLGGHSWGATTALAYAAWDFDGRPGYRDLSGLVNLDGGVHDAFAGQGDVYRLTAAQAAAWQRQIAGGAVFDGSLAAVAGRPETLQILQQLAGAYAVAAPDAPSTLAPRLPAPLRPNHPVSNAGLITWMLASHPLAAEMSINPAYTRSATAARALAGPVPAALEWYWPNRLTLDLEAADPFRPTPAGRLLGLRLWHAAQIDVPLYSFASGLTHGTVNAAARWVVDHSRIPAATFAENDAMTHLDTLWAAPGRSTVLSTLAPFLARLDER
ncbi:alpha/beta hydrolase [Streptacidiphilus pinicola]|uniref:Alpha/beta hydrolase n=1 Tax=Streptacidiphilus pinicola TaxID=2219663 RepID=A0A2X0IFM6_9ACTN|nr:alpha/beta hydrolase [Streptacidiphilus pinicola]